MSRGLKEQNEIYLKITYRKENRSACFPTMHSDSHREMVKESRKALAAA